MLSVDSTQSRHNERHVERLVVTALVLLALLPAIITFARTSPPLIAAIIALLLGISACLDGSWPTMREQFGRFALSPANALLTAALLFMGLSLLWTPVPERALIHLLHLLGSALLIGVLLTAVPLRHAERLGFLIPLGLAITSLLIILHFTTSGAVKAALGLSTRDSDLNRAAVALALLSPAVLIVLWRREKRLIACALGLLVLVAIWTSISWSAKLSSLVIIASAPLAFLAPRRFHAFALGGIIVSLLSVPLYAGIINSLIPQTIHDAVGYGSMAVRGEIWREYSALVWERPILGFGLEASNVAHLTEFATSLTDVQRHLLSYGHPHNAAVQIWFEFGLVGALLAAVLIGLLFRAMSKLKDSQLSIASTTSVGVYTVAIVSHGAWQAWWICLVGLVAFNFLLQIRRLNLDRGERPHDPRT